MKKAIIFVYFLMLSAFAVGQPDESEIDFTDFRSGMTNKRLGEYEKAIQNFTDFLNEYPEQSRAYYYRGHTYANLGQYDKALADFEILCKLDEKDPEAFYSAGRMSFAVSKFREAVNYLTRAIALQPNHAYAFNDRGMAYCYLDDFDAALIDFTLAVSIDSTFAMAYNNVGAARYFNQDIETPSSRDMLQAKDWFSKAIHFDNTLDIAYFNRAAMNYFLKDFEAAAKDLQKAQSLQPKDPMICLYQGLIAKKQKNFGQAAAFFAQAVALDPDLSFAYEEQGNAYLEQEDFSAAVAEYEKAKNAWKRSESVLYKGLMDYRIAVVRALEKDETAMYAALKSARSSKVFEDRKVYQAFLNERAFREFRTKKEFQKFAKTINGSKKYNKFLNAELSWFRMTL